MTKIKNIYKKNNDNNMNIHNIDNHKTNNDNNSKNSKQQNKNLSIIVNSNLNSKENIFKTYKRK